MPKKVVIIGAGSFCFSSRLTMDILSYESTRDAHFVLVDIDKTKLHYAEKIIKRIFREGGYNKASYSATMDRRKALKGADYVIISILVGGYEAIKYEIDIPMKYGVDQCIGDTLGPGGIMRCLRTLPILSAIGKDIMELCPKAAVMSYTNPMGMLTWGMLKANPGIKFVGLCHSVQGGYRDWAKRLGINHEEVNFISAGINHQAWFIKFEHKGVDLIPKMREKVLEKEIWMKDTSRSEYTKHFDYYVTESSGHNSEYNPWFRKRPELVKRYSYDAVGWEGTTGWNGRSGFIKELYARPNWEKEMSDMANGKTPLKMERSIEYGSQIINAIETNVPVTIYGNVLNNGIIDNLPLGACVEVPCQVDSSGIRPIKVGSLPTHLAAINRTQLNVQELAVEAALETDPEKVFYAMAMDPLTGAVLSLDEIRAMTIELMKAHSKFIPQFKGKLPASKPLIYKLKEKKTKKKQSKN
jgi:alpha-galactosidase